MSVKKETQNEAVQTYDGLHNSSQTFHAVGLFEVINGTIVMRTPEHMKRIDPRKYRDHIYKIDEAIGKYKSMGQMAIKLKEYGTRGMDELQELLDDFGAKIIEAIKQKECDNQPVSPAAIEFREAFKLWSNAGMRRAVLVKD